MGHRAAMLPANVNHVPPPYTPEGRPMVLEQGLTVWDGQTMTRPPMRAWIETPDYTYTFSDRKPRLMLAADDWMTYATLEETPVMAAANIRYAVKSFTQQTGLSESLVMQFVDRAMREMPATQGVVRERRDWEKAAAERLKARTAENQARQDARTLQERRQADLFALLAAADDSPDGYDRLASARIAYEDEFKAKWDASIPAVAPDKSLTQDQVVRLAQEHTKALIA